jgi:hypothetical protein
MEIGYLVPLLAAVIYISVCFVVVVNGTWQREHKLFILYLVAATLWSFGDFILRSSLFEANKLVLFRFVIWASLLWAVQFYAFVRAFLKLPDGWGVRFGHISLVVLGVAAALGFVPHGITYSTAP